MAEIIMLLAEHDGKVVQGRTRRPEIAGKRRILGRDGEQEQMVDREHRPYYERDADQQQLGFRSNRAERRELHRDSRFIRIKTSGSTSGSAQMIAVIERSTASRRK